MSAVPSSVLVTDLEKLGAEIQARMVELGMTKPMLGARAGVQSRYLTGLLTGKPPVPGRPTLIRIAKALMVPSNVLVDRVNGVTDRPLVAGIGDPDYRPEPLPDADGGPVGRLAEQLSRLEPGDLRLVEQMVARLLR